MDGLRLAGKENSQTGVMSGCWGRHSRNCKSGRTKGGAKGDSPDAEEIAEDRERGFKSTCNKKAKQPRQTELRALHRRGP